MRPALLLIAGLAWLCAAVGQARVRPESSQVAVSTPSPAALRWVFAGHSPMVASFVWAQTVSDYAGSRLTASDVEARVRLCARLDPRFSTPARLGVLMVATLPIPDGPTTERLLSLGRAIAPEDPWFTRGLALHWLKEPHKHHPDQPLNLLSLAAQSSPSPVAGPSQ